MIIFYTDGGTTDNNASLETNYSGAAYLKIDLSNSTIESVAFPCKSGTNNQMELKAIYEALGSLTEKEKEGRILLFSDSMYAIKGITEWSINWVKKDFKEVKNVDLWKALLNRRSTVDCKFIHVKAHSGNYFNEMADFFVGVAREKSKEGNFNKISIKRSLTEEEKEIAKQSYRYGGF